MVLAFGFLGQARLARPRPMPPASIAHLAAVGLPTRIADIRRRAARTPTRLMALMAQDKKVERGKLTFILPRGIGQAFVANDVEPARCAISCTKLPG